MKIIDLKVGGEPMSATVTLAGSTVNALQVLVAELTAARIWLWKAFASRAPALTSAVKLVTTLPELH